MERVAELAADEASVDSPTIAGVEVFAFRVPVTTARRALYGTQTARTALIVKLLDDEGCWGWGECFTNWPPFGVEHRMRLAREVIGPLVVGLRPRRPEDLSELLYERTAIMRIKSNEVGPFEQVIAAFDIALWDLWARRAGQPLHVVLGGTGENSAKLYASGLTAENLDQSVAWAKPLGIDAYKLKIGVRPEEDQRTLERLRALIGDADLMVDADQAWNLDSAIATSRILSEFGVDWLEEPLRADRPLTEWQALAVSTDLPIAAGENIRGEDNFDLWMAAKILKILQPDIIKWGGLSRVRHVWAKARAKGLRVCPHYLGGGIGLVATAHLAAAMGGDLLELDVSENPLRFMLASPFPDISQGIMKLPDLPGLGVEPDLSALAPHRL